MMSSVFAAPQSMRAASYVMIGVDRLLRMDLGLSRRETPAAVLTLRTPLILGAEALKRVSELKTVSGAVMQLALQRPQLGRKRTE